MRLPVRLLSQLADVLKNPHRSRPFPQQLWHRILTQGWAHPCDVDDLILAMDGRVFSLDLQRLAEIADYPTRLVRDTPRFVTADYIAMPMMAVADVVGFCIFLEHLGLTVDPEPMVASMYDQIALLQRLTISQAEIYSYKAFRHKHRLTLHAEESLHEVPTQQDWRSQNGYRFQCLSRGGQATMLTIVGPKWRRPRRIEMVCHECGAQYTKGDPGSALHHRTVHAEAMRLLRPQPSKRMREKLEPDCSAVRVDVNAHLWMHREVESRALRFKRDFGYDFTQWPSVSTRDRLDPRWVGFLFASADGAIDGACAFMDVDEKWSLQWVWIRPDRRRQGLLASSWPAFLAEFGDFWIEHPLSEGMHAFVARHASQGQLELIEKRYPDGSPIEQPVSGRRQRL